MRYVCVLLVLLGMPLPASAQREHRSDRPFSALGPIGLPLPAIGLPTPVSYPKPWEWTVQPAPWERRHVARPAYPDQRPQRYHTPSVIYVMQPYAVAQPYPVYVTVPAPPPPAPPAVEPVVQPEPPPPPVVLPTGSRTLYVIPGCYLGNVKPEAERLPEGCDLKRLKVYAPEP